MRNVSAKQRARNRNVDDDKWLAATNYVNAWSAWKKADKQFGTFAPEEREAWERLTTAKKEFDRVRLM